MGWVHIDTLKDTSVTSAPKERVGSMGESGLNESTVVSATATPARTYAQVLTQPTSVKVVTWPENQSNEILARTAKVRKIVVKEE